MDWLLGGARGFMPHGHCYLWRQDILWLHVLSDAGVALAYGLIPIAIARFVRLRRDLAFRWMFMLFAAFILSCGATHAFSIWTVWTPRYDLEGLLKAATAVISLVTAVLLIRLVPRALELPSPAALRAATAALEVEVRERRRAEGEAMRLASALEARVVERTRELERANEDLQQFVQVISHDLREPVRAVSNFTLLLDKRYGAGLDERARTYMHHAAAGAERAQQMLGDLVRYARLGAAPPDPEPFPLRDVVDDALADLALAFADARAQVRVGPLPVVRSSATFLRQIVQNLLSNALKYGDAHATPIEVTGEGGIGGFTLRVVDHGPGIPEEHRERVFEMFARLHTRREAEGSGVGLAICRRLAARLGGELTVETTPGGGATFTLTVPAAKADAAPRGTA